VQSAREWQALQAAQAAQVAAREAVLARGDLGQALGLCRSLWRDELHLHHDPSALAWTRRGLDGYFLEGSDRSSFRQVRCRADGVSRGPRVVHPLHELLPAEAPPEQAPEADDDWQLTLHRLSSRSLDPEDLAVELLRHPLTGAALTRRWRATGGGARATLEPADAPPFAMLVAAPEFPLAAGAAPPTPAASTQVPLARTGRHRVRRGRGGPAGWRSDRRTGSRRGRGRGVDRVADACV
jgi:hypothetical protein